MICRHHQLLLFCFLPLLSMPDNIICIFVMQLGVLYGASQVEHQIQLPLEWVSSWWGGCVRQIQLCTAMKSTCNANSKPYVISMSC
jgi:hypothetical protein